MLAVTLFAATPAHASSGDALSEYPIMNLSTPDGFESTTNPLGTDENTPVLLVEEAELLRFASWDNNRSSGSSTISMYDTLQTQTGGVETSASTTTTYDLRSSQTGVYGLSNVQAVSFDPTGSGRRDHVAFVGLDSDKNVKLVVYNTTTNMWSSKLDLGSMSRFPTNGTNYYAMDGALSITAGDYDNDRKDTIVVYAVTNGNCSYLHEVSANSTRYSISLDQVKATSAFINPRYADLGLNGSTDKTGRDMLRGEVRTGDFNGDNIDDIAVLTQVGKSKNFADDKYDYRIYAPYLSTAFGAQGISSVLSQAAVESSISDYQRTDGKNNQYFSTLYCASMAIGDFEGAGYDVIGIVGRELTIRDNKGSNRSDDWTFSDYLSIAKVYASSSAGHTMSLASGSTSQLAMNKLSKKAADTNSNDSASLGVSAVCFDGLGTAAYLVVDGCIYSWADSGSPVQIKNFANEGYWGNYGSRSYVNSQATGNFTAGEEGYEQLVFTLAEKNSSTQDDYHFRSVMIYASEHDPTTGVATDFACTTSPNRFVDDRGDNYDEGLNGVVVAIDNDDDGMIVKYDSKVCYYTDPEVLAVLQSAPYFEELYRNDAANLQNGGTTKLTLSEKHGTAYGESDSRELEAGLDIQLGGGFYPVTANIKVGYHGQWTSGWEESMSYEVSESFEASTCDQVIVYRTPVYCYNYKVYNPATGQYDGEASFTVKQRSTYVQMSLSDYERFVEDYNSTMEEKAAEWKAKNEGKEMAYARLYSLSNVDVLGNEGNPYAYTATGTSYGSDMSLGTVGGSSGIDYEMTSERTEYSEHTDGVYVGADIMTNIMFSPVNGGIEGNITFDWSSTSSTVKGKSVTFSGAVGNLVYTTFLSAGYDSSTYDAYHFDWRFSVFNTNIPSQTLAVGDELYDTVQVLGYHAENVQAPPARPELTCSSLVTTQDYSYFDLKWDTPSAQGQEKRPTAAKYCIYLSEAGTGKLVAEVDGSQTSYQFREFEEDRTEYIFYVVAVDADGNRSVASKLAYGETGGGTSLTKAVYKGIVKKDAETRYEYELTYNDGTKCAFYLISKGSQGVDRSRAAFLELQNEGLIPDKVVDWSAWNDVIDAIHNLNGCLDTGEASYTYELDECSEIRTTYCALCGNILTTRHELRAHDYQETVVTGACASQGYTAYKCKNCGFEKHDNWTGYRHDYQTVEVPGTCSSEGYTLEVCATCGEYHVVKQGTSPVVPDSHSYVASEPVYTLVDSDGDGKTDGHVYVECSVCEYCGDVAYGDVVSETSHELVEGYVKTTDADGTAWYTQTEFCRHCEYSQALAEPMTKEQMFGSSEFWNSIASRLPSVREGTLTLDTLAFTNIKTNIGFVSPKTSSGGIGYIDTEGSLTLPGEFIGDTSSAYITIIENDGRWTLKPLSAWFYIYGVSFGIYPDMAWWLMCEACAGSDAPHAYLDSFFDAKNRVSLHICALCGHMEATGDAHTHTFADVQVPETITGAGGYVRKVCSVCGYSETTTEGYDPQKVTQECEHSWVELEHTCTDSERVRRVCAKCGETELIEKALTAGGEVVHQYDVTVVEPTCTSGGYTLKTCVRCGVLVKVDETAALGHVALAGADTVVGPTCEHAGYTSHVCERCGEEYTDNPTAQLPHEYADSGLTTVAATCSSGEVTLNHCIYCGKTIQVGEEGEPDANAHDYDEQLYPMTCTTKGCINYICRHCGDMYTVYLEDLPDSDVTAEENTPVGHVEDTTVAAQVVDPTETKAGYTIRHCAVCGEDYQTDPTDPVEPVRTSTIFYGEGAPKNSLGQDGDLYIDHVSHTFYVKSNGTWSKFIGVQSDPDVNIAQSQGKSACQFFSSAVPEADQQVISDQIGKITVTGIDDNLRLTYQKKLLEKCFPDLWEKVPMDSFLKDDTNKVEIRIQTSVNAVASDLQSTESPFNEYSFTTKVYMVITSPVFGSYSAEYVLTPEDFANLEANITVTIPVPGNIAVEKVQHINSSTGEVYESFTQNGNMQFTYDQENNTVSVTIGHFSNIRIEGAPNQSSADGGDSADEGIKTSESTTSGAASGQGGSAVANTGDEMSALAVAIAGIIATLALAALVAFRVRRE